MATIGLTLAKANIYTNKGTLPSIFVRSTSVEALPKTETHKKLSTIYNLFESLERFAKEAHRVLKPGGKLAVASFFGTSEKSHSSLSTMIPTIKDEIDKATPVYQFEKTLKKNGFKNIKIESIGKNVWYGFDQWTAQGDLKDSWTRNWYKGYQKGLLDYYLITAEKSN